jgi:hypothetical protein
MGYYTHVAGLIDINPPIPWAEFKDSPFYRPNGQDRNVYLGVVETTVDTSEGTLTRREAVAIEPTWGQYRWRMAPSSYSGRDHPAVMERRR